MSAIIVRIILFLLVLFIVGELLKRLRRSKTSATHSTPGLIKIRESVALNPSSTVTALEIGAQLYVVVTGNGAAALIDKLPASQMVASDLKQRRINGLK